MRPHSNTPILDKFIAIIGIAALFIGIIESSAVFNMIVPAEKGINVILFTVALLILGSLSMLSLLMNTKSKIITFLVAGIPVETFIILNSIKPEIRTVAGLFLITTTIGLSVLTVMKISDIE